MNIVRFEESYFAVPQELRMNWAVEKDLFDIHIIKADNLESLFQKIGNIKITYKIKIRLILLSLHLNYYFYKIPEIIKNKGFKYLIKRSLFILKQLVFELFRSTVNKFTKFSFKTKEKNKNFIKDEIKSNQDDKKEVFIKDLNNYKIYKMEGVYYGFSKGEKINFDEIDYMMNDNVIKDYSIDAVEAKILELR